MQNLRSKRPNRVRQSILCASFLSWAAAGCGSESTAADIETTEAPSAAASALTSSTSYRIVSAMDGLSVNVNGASTKANATIIQWGYATSATNSQWQATSTGGNYYTLRAANSGLCLGSPANNTANGTGLVQLSCSGNNTQWSFTAAPSGASYLVNRATGLCMSVGNASWSPGQQYVQWTCVQGNNQQFRMEALTSGVPTFGYRTLHPRKVGFYMTPDFYSAWYWQPTSSGSYNWAPLQASFNRLQQLIPGAMVRWDTEFGHNNGDAIPVNTTLVGDVLTQARPSGTLFMIAAEGVPGYNNYWAGGGQTPNTTMLQMGASGTNEFPSVVNILQNYNNVKFVETTNEPDNGLFNSDGDNAANFATYYSEMLKGTGVASSRVVGPAVSWPSGNIWNKYLSIGSSNVSYHTYSGCNTITDVNNKSVYVTEYGGNGGNGWSGNGNSVAYPSPGWVLADMWYVEHDQHLNNTVQMLFYHQLFDDSIANRGAFLHASTQGTTGHFQVRDWLHALSMYVAAAGVSGNAYFNEAQPDYFATDDGKGNTSVVLYNYAMTPYSQQQRGVPGATAAASATWYVAHVAPGDTETFTCYPLTDARQTWVNVLNNASGGSPSSMVTINVNQLEPHAAVLVSTKDCSALAN